MNTNKINIIKTEEEQSHGSNDYEIKSETLDQLYKKQITELRDLIFKKAQLNDVEICRKWLKVFNKTTNAEKIARNCLCTLMQQQLKESNCLQKPFTNLQNCNRNLETILQELDDFTSANFSNKSFATISENTFKSHKFEDVNQSQSQYFELSQNINVLENECQNIVLRTETDELKHELQTVRLQLTEKQIENIKLQEIAEKLRLERETFEQMLDNMKKSLLECIKEILLNMEENGLNNKQFDFFRRIFVHFANDEEFMYILKKYDLYLQHILHKHFKCEFDKRKKIIARHILRKFMKTQTKLKKQYEKRLIMQTESHKLQLKLAKLNCFSILRQIFINYHREFGKIEGWEILKTLEDKYQNIINGDIQ